jgi:hypothetical protein
VVAVSVGLLAAGGALAFASQRIIGPDDAIYLAGARSMAESGQYLQGFLPTPLPQTKYPPLYSACLAVIGHFTSFEPSAFWYLKACSAAALAALAVLCSAVVYSHTRRPAWAVVAGVLAATGPATFAAVDQLASDLLFSALLMAVCLWAPQLDRPRGHLWLALLAGLCALSRTVGIAVCLGLAIHVFTRLDRRRAVETCLVMAAVVGPWLAWRAYVFPDAGPLEWYFVTYEQSAWTMLLESPGHAANIIAMNLRVYPTLVPMVFGWPFTALAVVASVLTVMGWRRLTSRRALFAWIVVIYIAVLVGHPYAIDRYLVPLVPLAVVGLVSALAVPSAGGNLAARVAAWYLAAILLLSHGIWLTNYWHVSRTAVHGAFGRAITIQWEGWKAAQSWIATHTEPSDAIASYRNSVDSTYSGRRVIRAWLHLVEAWSPHDRQYRSPAAIAKIVAAEYDRLGVRYILVSPPLQDVEGHFGQAVLDQLHLGSEATPLVFASDDGSHRIYRWTASSSGVK